MDQEVTEMKQLLTLFLLLAGLLAQPLYAGLTPAGIGTVMADGGGDGTSEEEEEPDCE